MKKTIYVAVRTTHINTKQIEVDFPQTKKYYSKNDDGNFFPRGLVLFAIIPLYCETETVAYTLVEVERNKQDYNDFWPTKDCRQNYWLTDSIRNTALDIITGKAYEFKEVTEEYFFEKRELLLNQFSTKKLS